MSSLQDQTYLGDGVYAAHDGYQIWLGVDRNGRQERVALEPAVFAALVQYEQKLRMKYAAGVEEQTEPKP